LSLVPDLLKKKKRRVCIPDKKAIFNSVFLRLLELSLVPDLLKKKKRRICIFDKKAVFNSIFHRLLELSLVPDLLKKNENVKHPKIAKGVSRSIEDNNKRLRIANLRG